MNSSSKWLTCGLCTTEAQCEWADTYGAEDWYCKECIEWFNTFQAEGLDSTPFKAEKAKQGKAVQKHVKLCSHNLQPLRLPSGHVIYLSANLDLQSTPQGPAPTACVYLDNAWVTGKLFSSDGLVRDTNGPAVLFFAWPDYQGVSVTNFVTALDWVDLQLSQGRVLEVGCVGGHGRTGTFVAGLLMLSGMGVVEAVAYVRAYYCRKAIESSTQIELLFDLYDVLNNVEVDKEVEME